MTDRNPPTTPLQRPNSQQLEWAIATVEADREGDGIGQAANFLLIELIALRSETLRPSNAIQKALPPPVSAYEAGIESIAKAASEANEKKRAALLDVLAVPSSDDKKGDAETLADKIEGIQDDGGEGVPWSQDELDLMVKALRAMPSAVGERETMLLALIELVRCHPDFDQGGPMADAMDQALRGETPKLLVDVAYLREGRQPPAVQSAIGARDAACWQLWLKMFRRSEAGNRMFCEIENAMTDRTTQTDG